MVDSVRRAALPPHVSDYKLSKCRWTNDSQTQLQLSYPCTCVCRCYASCGSPLGRGESACLIGDNRILRQGRLQVLKKIKDIKSTK